MDAEEASVIGQRARMIRRRRGLSLDVVAGLAGISTPYLSMLERGQRGFNRRGLLEDLAGALGCSVADLTGQPYLPPDRATADALATLPAVSAAMHDVTLDDVPDGPTRSVDDLARAASKALADSDDVQFATGSGLGAVITELHIQAAAGDAGSRRKAELSSEPGPTSGNTVIAEACGMLHLSAALVSARDGRTGDASTHLGEARSLAVHTGERNHIRFHFGPANVAAWDLSIAVETDSGPEAAERFVAAPINLSVFGSRDREVSVHFDLARAWAQAEGARDAEALRALDTADRIAPVRVRNDPIARDLVLTLDRRARRRVWELDSLRNRFGVGRPTSRTVKS